MSKTILSVTLAAFFAIVAVAVTETFKESGVNDRSIAARYYLKSRTSDFYNRGGSTSGRPSTLRPPSRQHRVAPTLKTRPVKMKRWIFGSNVETNVHNKSLAARYYLKKRTGRFFSRGASRTRIS